MAFRNWFHLPATSDASLQTIWRLIAFADLRPAELYGVLRLRSAVFVIEQQCLYADMDGLDPEGMHLLGVADGQLCAYARCFGPGVCFAEASFGRVLTAPHVRAQGLGHVLVRQALTALRQVWGPQPVRIAAQQHLVGFYARHGFAPVDPPYVEDGIAHQDMLRPAD
ncbi:MAG: GNAT family N-acetyltransferase [Rhodoferax sp.]